MAGRADFSLAATSGADWYVVSSCAERLDFECMSSEDPKSNCSFTLKRGGDPPTPQGVDAWVAFCTSRGGEGWIESTMSAEPDVSIGENSQFIMNALDQRCADDNNAYDASAHFDAISENYA